jgi:cytochrome c biogenesis protein CcmG/thiol:disulfide interchange protein DsbE
MRLAAALLLALALPACASMPPSLLHPLAGAQAPPLPAEAPSMVGIPSGAPVKVTVLDFWASWCEGCQVSLPALDAIYRDKREDGVRVIGVSLDERAENAYALAAALHTSFPVVVDDGRLASQFRVAQVPLTFVIDGNGTVRWVGRDPTAVRRAVSALLAE